jgi:hypothetical protein
LRLTALLGFISLAFLACSSDNDPPPPPPPAAPRLVEAAEMEGAVHLTWDNQEPACDNIEVERKAASPDGKPVAEYAVVYTLPGAADNKHDATAVAGATYTYRLRCKKASLYSAYSNELSATPTAQ